MIPLDKTEKVQVRDDLVLPNFNDGMSMMAKMLASVVNLLCQRNEQGQYCMAQIQSMAGAMMPAEPVVPTMPRGAFTMPPGMTLPFNMTFPAVTFPAGVSMPAAPGTGGMPNVPGVPGGMPNVPGVPGGMPNMPNVPNVPAAPAGSVSITVNPGAGGSAEAGNAAMCTMLTNSGCCFSAFVNTMAQMVSSVATTPGVPAIDVSGMMAEMQTEARTRCGLQNMRTSCTPTPGNSARLLGKAQLSLAWNWWNSQSALKQEQVRNAFCSDLAATGGFYANLCNVTSVTPATASRRLLQQSGAGTNFNYQVLGLSTTSLQQTSGAIGTVSFQDLSQAAGMNVTGSNTVTAVEAAPSAPASSASLVAVGRLALFAAILLLALLF